MPLAPQRFHHHIRHRLPALATLGAVAVSVAVATPRVPVLLDERRAGVERIAALRAEEVTGVPLCAASDDDFAFDRRFARFAARAEHFVEVEGAVEAQGGLAVALFGFVEFVDREVLGNVAGVAGCDAFEACVALGVGFGVEGDVFEVCVAFVAVEAGWVEALAGG